jgi:hypothetical protein
MYELGSAGGRLNKIKRSGQVELLEKTVVGV